MIKLLVVAAVAVLALAEDQYTSKYDNINVDEIISNERLYKKYFDCVIGPPDAKCTPDAKYLKDTLPDALKTDCSKCTPKQKSSSDKVIKFMLEKKPDDYKKVEEIFDPTGSYRKKHFS